MAVENDRRSQLVEGLARLGLSVPHEAPDALLALLDELEKWNRKVSLTAITGASEMVEKHLLDSLSVLPELQGATELLDLGAGAGLPGLPLAVALPELRVTLVDAVAKKVAFMKAAAVKMGVASRVKAVHLRVEGDREREQLAACQVIISRAFMDVGPFLSLARAYLAPGGRVVAMLGRRSEEAGLREVGRSAGFALDSLRAFTLPRSGDPRAVAVFR